jgi:hypothetical protein
MRRAEKYARALRPSQELYPGSWDDLGNELPTDAAIHDSEENILVDIGIDTSVDSDSSSDSLDHSDPLLPQLNSNSNSN